MFKKAERQKVKLKLAITGPSGSGKTYSANRLARGLVGPNGRIALIDTENGSASLYADRFDFDVMNIEDKTDHTLYGEAITAAAKAGYDCLILDSFSHVWEAILDYKTRLDGRGGNSYTNWAEAGKRFRQVLDAILISDMHVICCLRSKTEYVLEENEKGKHVPRKVGMAPIMRDGIEFEFTTVFDLDFVHNAQTSKDRTGIFHEQIFQITEETGEQLVQWLNGAKAEKPVVKESLTTEDPKQEEDPFPVKPTVNMITREQLDKLHLYWKTLKKTDEDKPKAWAWAGNPDAKKWTDLTEEQAEKLIKFCQNAMNGPAKPAKPAKKAAPKDDEIPYEFLPAWVELNEERVNAQLLEWGWIEEGQTFRDLDDEKRKKILEREDKFAAACGVILNKEKEVA